MIVTGCLCKNRCRHLFCIEHPQKCHSDKFDRSVTFGPNKLERLPLTIFSRWVYKGQSLPYKMDPPEKSCHGETHQLIVSTIGDEDKNIQGTDTRSGPGFEPETTWFIIGSHHESYMQSEVCTIKLYMAVFCFYHNKVERLSPSVPSMPV